jgi:hypothetical protein
MNNQLAEELLSKVMNWEPTDFTRIRPSSPGDGLSQV